MPMPRSTRTLSEDASSIQCKRIEVQGRVQGVGFRPFVYGLARELGLFGIVVNTGAGARVEVEGAAAAVGEFMARLRTDLPPLAAIDLWAARDALRKNWTSFTILESERQSEMRSLVLPDVATCPDCLAELNDPRNRRFQYPFTNCTNCGPRYSIIEGMPYDRAYTTMAAFPMCDACQAEYKNPADRRFHAQPIACPRCGPHVELWSREGRALAAREEALALSVAALKAGMLVALKGLGGFQLLADARNEGAVNTLRARKRREGKPFAVMFPSLEEVCHNAAVEQAHADLLRSPQSPIVLIPSKRGAANLAPSVAPDTWLLGIMLPYTPLHHLILTAFGGPLVATSGNLGEEPICIDEREALVRLHGVADLFLVHNRPIARQVDDSIVVLVQNEPMVLRRARGYAPAPLHATSGSDDMLAVGGHLKNTVACSKGGTIFPSQHIGNLESAASLESFQRTTGSMLKLFEMAPKRIVCDLHPDYASTRFAGAQGLPVLAVQHHFAHVLSCMAEHGLEGPVLGVSWDGTGYGSDGTIWGGEFLRCTRERYDRLASLRPFRLPGGEAAVRDARRPALGLLYEVYGKELVSLKGVPPIDALDPRELRILAAMLERGVNSPQTTSMGRLFDAVASLCGLCHGIAFEGQAAMRLERAAVRCSARPCPMAFDLERRDGRLVLDWKPMIEQIVASNWERIPADRIARGFHDALADGIVRVAQTVDLQDVVLTGGCFQNTLLLEQSLEALNTAGFKVYRHGVVPPNDGGIAIGQAWYRPGKEC